MVHVDIPTVKKIVGKAEGECQPNNIIFTLVFLLKDLSPPVLFHLSLI